MHDACIFLFQFKCCGFESYMDYEDNPGFQCGSGRPQDCGVPWTCCRKPKGVHNKVCFNEKQEKSVIFKHTIYRRNQPKIEKEIGFTVANSADPDQTVCLVISVQYL